MYPAKTKEHEPTAVKKRTWILVEPRQHQTDTEPAQEMAGKIRMILGIAGVSETGSKYEQGAKCSRNYSANHTNRLMVFCPILLSPQYQDLYFRRRTKKTYYIRA